VYDGGELDGGGGGEKNYHSSCRESDLGRPVRGKSSSVGIALRYWLDDKGSRVPLPAGAGNFSLHHRVQNGSGAHPASHPMGTKGSFPGGKAARA
jgi:hypothetical protein